MSEPTPKLDLTALSDALGDEESTTISNEVKTSELDSPATLSPKSRDVSPEAIAATPPSQIATLTTPAAPTVAAPTETEHPDANVRNIKAMFPDLDVDTIHAVLVAEGGDFERAINTLLQMSDPTYVAPPPRQQNSQQDQDEQLARSIAAQDEQERGGRNQQSQSFFPSGRGGGGLGSLFGGNQSSSSEASSPSYNPNQLNYQPRVKRATSGGPQQPSYQPYQAKQQVSSSAQRGDTPAAGWPGPRDAKVWQEDINKLAESGFAKAASTFSALRQRGERAFQGVSQPQSGSGSVAGQQPAASSRRPATNSTTSAISPTFGSHRGFDKDPAPVGDNELAKILARGREEGKKPSIAERYKKVSAGNSRSQSKDNVNDQGEEDDDDALGWDDAGRTGSNSVAPSFEPIRISDNSSAAAATTLTTEDTVKPKLPTAPRNAVSLMEGSAGRGLTSPQRSSSTKAVEEQAEEDDGNDDLEYISNPFEDED